MARRSSSPTPFAAWALAGFLVWLVGYPLLVTFAEALARPGGGWGLDGFAALLARGDELEAVLNSLWISLASVAVSAALGVPVAFLLARWDFPGRRLLGALLTLPVALPPLVGVIAFLFLYGESGLVARALMEAVGLEEAPWRLRGAGAILLVHAYSMYVYFLLFVRAALARIDGSLAEAAASLGAGRARTLFRVTLPLLRPALVGASLLTFLTSLASFSAPYIFGGDFRVMPTQIVASRLNGDARMAMVESVALALLAFAALALASRLRGRGEVYAASHGAAAPRPRPVSGSARALATVGAWAVAAVLLLPHATLVLLSFVPLGTWTVEAFPPVLDLSNWRSLFAQTERLRPIVNSLWMATVASAAALGLGFAAARLARRSGGRTGRALEGLVAFPWAVPGTVFAVALAATFGVHRPELLRFVLIGTPWLLPLAYLLRALPLTGRAAISGLAQLDPALEEAAASLGAGRRRTLRRITLPLVRPALAAGLSLAFIAALGDFVTSILLYTYTNRPIAIEILSSLRLQETGLAAAYGVLLTGVSVAALLVWGQGETEARAR